MTGVETLICKNMNIAASAKAEQQEYITLAVSQLAKACNEDRTEAGSMCKFADKNNRVQQLAKTCNEDRAEKAGSVCIVQVC